MAIVLAINGTEYMRVDGDRIGYQGYVGIGTTTPGQKLDVAGGSIRTTNQFISTLATGIPPLVVNSGTLVTNLNADMTDGFHAGNANGNIPVSNGSVNTNLNADLLDGYHANSFALSAHFHSSLTNGQGIAPFNYNGSSPAMISLANSGVMPGLYSNANITVDSYGRITSAHNGSDLSGNGTTNYVAKWLSSSNLGSGILYDDGSKVGIGRTNPTAKVDVWQSDGIVARFVGDGYGASSNTYLGIKDSSANVFWLLQASDNGTFSIHQDGAGERITIDNTNGNVGIGTTSPGQKLDISGGSVRTTGQFISTQGIGTSPLSVSSTTLVANLNTDLHDGNHAGNANGNVPISNGAVNSNLNADMVDGSHNGALSADLLDGYHAGNAGANIPVSNGILNTNLNSDKVDGNHASTTATGTTNTVWVNSAAGTSFTAVSSVSVTYGHFYNFEVIASLEWSTHGGIAHIIGFENDGNLIIAWYASNGNGTMSWGEAKGTEGTSSVLFAFGNGSYIIRVKTSATLGTHTLILETNDPDLTIRTTYR